MTEASSPAETSRRRTRDRAGTEARLRRGLEELLVEKGFAALTPSAVAQRAGVDKMLIYRYFGGLEGLVRTLAYAPDFFPSFEDLCGGLSPETLLARPVGARAAHVLTRNAEALMARPAVLELMVWELVERNELTAILEEARERVGLEVMERLFPDVPDRRALAAASAVLSAGVTYLALRRRKIRLYAGVDLRTDEGWAAIEAAIARLASGLEGGEVMAFGASEGGAEALAGRSRSE